MFARIFWLGRKKRSVPKARVQSLGPGVDQLESRANPAVDMTLFPIAVPESYHFENIQTLSAARDGQIWFVENLFDANNKDASEICRFSMDGQTTVVVPISVMESIRIGEMTAGSDGNQWFVGSHATGGVAWEPIVGRITEDGQVTTFPLGGQMDASHIKPAADGGFWVLGSVNNGPTSVSQGLLMHVGLTGAVTTVPLLSTPFGLTMEGLATDRAGNVWVGGYLRQNVEPYQTASVLFRHVPNGDVSQYSVLPRRVVPIKDLHAIFQANSVEINSLATGPDGNVWFTAADYSTHVPRSVWKATPRGHFARSGVFPIGVNGLPSGMIAGHGHALYFMVGDTNWDVPSPLFKIGVVNTQGHVRLLRVPHTDDYWNDGTSADPGEMVVGADGNIWFSNWLAMMDSVSTTAMARVRLPQGHKKA